MTTVTVTPTPTPTAPPTPPPTAAALLRDRGGGNPIKREKKSLLQHSQIGSYYVDKQLYT